MEKLKYENSVVVDNIYCGSEVFSRFCLDVLLPTYDLHNESTFSVREGDLEEWLQDFDGASEPVRLLQEVFRETNTDVIILRIWW